MSSKSKNEHNYSLIYSYNLYYVKYMKSLHHTAGAAYKYKEALIDGTRSRNRTGITVSSRGILRPSM